MKLSYSCGQFWKRLRENGTDQTLNSRNIIVIEIIELMFRLVGYEGGPSFVQVGYDDTSIWLEYSDTNAENIEARIPIGLTPQHSSMIWQFLSVIFGNRKIKKPSFLTQWSGIVELTREDNSVVEIELSGGLHPNQKISVRRLNPPKKRS